MFFSVYTLRLSLFICFMLISGFSMEQLEEKLSDKIESNDDQYLSQDEYDILMDQLGRAILSQKLLETYKEGSYLDDDENKIEKRHPKWRSGETRSRVKLLNHFNDYNNNHQKQNPEYSPLLRKIWEKNMLEKNRMYQNLYG